jgi:hypothetical protein
MKQTVLQSKEPSIRFEIDGSILFGKRPFPVFRREDFC